jgi:hypothetical protein
MSWVFLCPNKEVSMDVQAYRVAVRIALDDQITRNMLQVSRDAIQLNKKFVEMTKNIKTVTIAAKEASSAMRSMNSAMNNQFSGATRGANEYASAMRSAADHAQRASTATRNLPALTGGYGGGSAFPAMAAGAFALSAGSAGGGGGSRGGNGLMALPSPQSQGGGWGGWNNGVPPGGWGGGGSGGGGNGSSNRGLGPGSHADGMTNLATGYLGFKLLDGFVDEAAKYQTLTEKFNNFGLGEGALKEAEKFASATKVFGSSTTDMLQYFTEAQGVFRESGAHTLKEQLAGAKLAAPMMAKINFAMTAMDPHAKPLSEAQQMDMLRFVEQAGGLTSPKRFNELMNASFKAVVTSGGNVDFSQYRQFMARSGVAAMNLSDKALFASLEPIIGEMKGSTAGFANRTLYNRLNGIIKLPNQVVNDLMKNGVWDKDKITLNAMGGIKRFEGNPLIGAEILSKQGATEFYKQVLLPSYKARGLNETDIQRENALIGGSTGGAMLNLIDKQLQIIEHSEAGWSKIRDLDPTAKAGASTYNGKAIDFQKKWENLQLVLGKDGGLLDTFTKGLEGLTSIMQRMTDIAHKNPELAKFVGQAALAVTALASVSGSIWLMKHATGALIGPLKFLTGSSGFPLLEKSLGTLPNAVTLAIGGVLAASTVEIYNRIKAMKDGRPYDQIASQSAEMSERDRLAHENAKANGGSYKPWAPSQSDFDSEKGRYPSVPPKSSSASNQPVNLLLTHEGRQVLVATVIGGMSKQATKAPSSTSAFDSSMLMAYPGQVSKLSTPN